MVDATGEPHFLRDRGLLESACDRPANKWHYGGESDLLALAGCLMFGIALNHPFEQGNKRTGFTAAQAFLRSNGYELCISDDIRVALDLKDVIEHKLAEEEFLDRLYPFVQPL